MELLLIDHMLQMEHLGRHFSLFLEETDVLFLLTQFLTLKDLIQLLKTNTQTYQLVAMPAIEVRLLRAQLEICKIADFDALRIPTLSVRHSCARRIPRECDYRGMPKKTVGIKELRKITRPHEKEQPKKVEEKPTKQEPPSWMRSTVNLSSSYNQITSPRRRKAKLNIPKAREVEPSRVELEQSVGFVSSHTTQLLCRLQSYYQSQQKSYIKSINPTPPTKPIFLTEYENIVQTQELYKHKPSLLTSAVNNFSNFMQIVKFCYWN